MKGKLILQPIDNPIEGTKVVYGNEVNPYKVGTYSNIVNIPNDSYPNHPWNGLHVIKEAPLAPWEVSDLKQIAVEYEEKVPKTSGFWADHQVKSLPLHPEDYEVAIALIGHEVEFEQTLYPHVEVEEGLWAADPRKPIAKLLLPTPVRTIEDIPEELRYKYPNGFDGVDDYLHCIAPGLNEGDTPRNEVFQDGWVAGFKACLDGKHPEVHNPVEETWDDMQDEFFEKLKKMAQDNGMDTRFDRVLSYKEVWDIFQGLKQHYQPPIRK